MSLAKMPMKTMGRVVISGNHVVRWMVRYKGFVLEAFREPTLGGDTLTFHSAVRDSDGWILIDDGTDDSIQDAIALMEKDVDHFLSEDYDGCFGYPPHNAGESGGCGEGAAAVGDDSQAGGKDTQNAVRQRRSSHAEKAFGTLQGGQGMRFYHIIRNRKRGSKHTALGITLALEITEPTPHAADKRYDVLCGVAYCAPIERTFSRPKGRLISASRLQNIDLMPLHKKFMFSVRDLKLLKATALSMLVANCPIKWAVDLATAEMEAMTLRWLQNGGMRALDAARTALLTPEKTPRRLAAKTVLRSRYKIDRNPHKQEIIARLKDGQSARAIARMLRARGNPISYTTISRHRRRLMVEAATTTQTT